MQALRGIQTCGVDLRLEVMWLLNFSELCLHLSELLGSIFIFRIFCSHGESSHILSFLATPRVFTPLKVTGYRNHFILNESLFLL
jgi:hypothetical protein